MKIKKITKILLDKAVFVCDLCVNDTHNFMLSNGCIVHNSKDCADSVAGAVFNVVENIAYVTQSVSVSF